MKINIAGHEMEYEAFVLSLRGLISEKETMDGISLLGYHLDTLIKRRALASEMQMVVEDILSFTPQPGRPFSGQIIARVALETLQYKMQMIPQEELAETLPSVPDRLLALIESNVDEGVRNAAVEVYRRVYVGVDDIAPPGATAKKFLEFGRKYGNGVHAPNVFNGVAQSFVGDAVRKNKLGEQDATDIAEYAADILRTVRPSSSHACSDASKLLRSIALAYPDMVDKLDTQYRNPAEARPAGPRKSFKL